MNKFTRMPDWLNAAPIRIELTAQPLAWGKSPRVTFPGSPHQATEDIILRGPIKQPGDTLMDLYNRVECEDYDAAEIFPNTIKLAKLLAVMVADSYDALGRVILTKLPPGTMIEPHRDEGDVPAFYKRYHLVIEGDRSVFICGGDTMVLQPGELWEIDVREMHSVANHGSDDRIHLIMDIER